MTIQVQAASTKSPAPAHGHGGTIVIGGLQITPDQITTAGKPIVDATKSATESLTQALPPAMAQRMAFRGLKPDTADFATGMAGVQQSYPTQLGHLSTSPQAITQGVDLAAAADAIIGPLETYVTILRNVRDYSLSTAGKDAGVIYRRARSVAETFPEVGKAIARFADALSRAARKGVAVRRQKARAAAATHATVPAAPETGKTTTTTVTTTEK